MMATAAVLAVGGSAGGLYLSYYAGIAAGASISLVLVGAFVVALVRDRLASRVEHESRYRLAHVDG
jgi:ABC-type Mn2+/Zn2+ transport system permease subunit